MKTILISAFTFVAVAYYCASPAQDKAVDPKLEAKAGDVALTHDLVLREEQGGTGGTSVKTWTLDKAGKWSLVYSFIDLDGKPGESTVLRSGTLTKERMVRVAEVLRSQRVRELPPKLGNKPKVNAHIYTLSFDKTRSTLYGIPPGKGSVKAQISDWLPKGAEQDAMRFAEIATVIVESCQAKS